MTSRHLPARSTRTLTAAVALAAALGLSSCGVLPDRAETDSSAGQAPVASSSAPVDGASSDAGRDQGGTDDQDGGEQPAEVLGSSTGQHVADPNDSTAVPLRLDVMSVTRAPGDAVEVRFTLTNTSDTATYEPWSTLADRTVASGGSLDVGGATLTDLPNDRKYLTLIDSEEICLCSTFPGLGNVEVAPGTTLELYAQFPAPPEATTTVDFGLPGFAPVAGLEIG